ncbi:PDC sensor domain-containing protein, partial [Campylobacter jejuni]|nr:PDC sensor domain-containing protein [Campylobacter jejuni]
MKSVKIKVALIANLIAVACLVILGVVTFIFVKQKIFDEVINTQESYVKTSKNSMESFIEKNSLIVQSVAKNILKHPLSHLDNQEALMQYLGESLKVVKDTENFLATYIALPNGELIVSDSDSDTEGVNFRIYGKANNYDARTREYFIEAVKQNKLYISPSYIDETTKLPCFTYAIPLYKDGKFIGVLAVDILVSDLQANFEKLPGNTFVFDEKNKVFVSSDKTLLNSESDISKIANIARTKQNFEPFIYSRDDEEFDRFAICAKVSENYTTCVRDTMQQVEEPVYKIAFIQAIIVVITSIISVILLYFIVSKYLSPLA